MLILKANSTMELNKEFTCNGVPKICDNGFHFCKHLGQVINNYYEAK